MMRRNLKVGDVFRSDKLPKGDYVVEKTEMTGGSTGHGPYDVYPDEHQVTARRLNRDGVYNARNHQIKFFQSGCFGDTNVIKPKDIFRVGLMKRTFVKTVQEDQKCPECGKQMVYTEHNPPEERILEYPWGSGQPPLQRYSQFECIDKENCGTFTLPKILGEHKRSFSCFCDRCTTMYTQA